MMEGQSGEEVENELESVTSSGDWSMLCMADGMRQNMTEWDKVDSRDDRLVIFGEDVAGRERVTTYEERVPRGAGQRSGCADK